MPNVITSNVAAKTPRSAPMRRRSLRWSSIVLVAVCGCWSTRQSPLMARPLLGPWGGSIGKLWDIDGTVYALRRTPNLVGPLYWTDEKTGRWRLGGRLPVAVDTFVPFRHGVLALPRHPGDTMLWSGDKGMSWQKFGFPPMAHAIAYVAVGQSIAFAVSDQNDCLVSTASRVEWRPVLPRSGRWQSFVPCIFDPGSLPLYRHIRQVVMAGDSLLFILANSDRASEIVYSRDAGNTWRQLDFGRKILEAAANKLTVHVVDDTAFVWDEIGEVAVPLQHGPPRLVPNGDGFSSLAGVQRWSSNYATVGLKRTLGDWLSARTPLHYQISVVVLPTPRGMLLAPHGAGIGAIDSGGRVTDADSGIASELPTQLVRIGGHVFANNGTLTFVAESLGAPWRHAPDSLLPRGVQTAQALISDSTFAYLISERGTFRTSVDTVRWSPLTRSQFGMDSTWVTRTLVADAQGALLSVAIDRSNAPMITSVDGGQSWHPLPQRASVFATTFTAVEGTLYMGTSNGVLSSLDRGQNWSIVGGPLWTSTVGAIAGARDMLYIGTDYAGIATLRRSEAGRALWRRRAANQLYGNVTALWVDPHHPDIVVAGTDQDVFWSNDGGEQFHTVPLATGLRFGPTSWLQMLDHRLVAATATGLYEIPTTFPHRESLLQSAVVGFSGWYQTGNHKLLTWIATGIATPLLAYLGALAWLLILVWTRGSAVLARSVIRRRVAVPLGWVPGVSRNILFAGYERRLMTTPDIQVAGANYFGLPAADSAGTIVLPDQNGNAVIDWFANHVGSQRPVLLTGRGGAGKSTTLARLAWLSATRQLPGALAGYRAILVPASFYRDNLVTSVADVLLERYGVQAEPETLVTQLETGRFLLLVDGASELNTGDRAQTLAALVREAQQDDFKACRTIIATRYIPNVNWANDAPPELAIKALDPGVVSLLLAPYQLGAAREQRIRAQLSQFGKSPIDPLLLRLAIDDSNSGNLTTSRAELYERYIRRILRVSRPEQDFHWAGWAFILERIAGWSLVDSGMRGVGLRHLDLVQKLETPGSTMDQSYSVAQQARMAFSLSLPEEGAGVVLVQQLQSAGVLTGTPSSRWSFAHDTFEEYFAARYLISLTHGGPPWSGPPPWENIISRQSDFAEVIRFIVDIGCEELCAHLTQSGSLQTPEPRPMAQ